MRPDSCFHCLCLKYFMPFSLTLPAVWFCLLLKNVLVKILKTNFLFLAVWDSHPIAESGEYFSKATKLLWRTEIPIYWSKNQEKHILWRQNLKNSLEGIVRPPLEISDKYAFREVSARSLASSYELLVKMFLIKNRCKVTKRFPASSQAESTVSGQSSEWSVTG